MVNTTLTLPTLEEIEGLVKLHKHLDLLLGNTAEVAGYVEEGIIRQCPECTCWCYGDDFRECVGYIPGEGNEYEVRDTCRWCREDIQ